MDIVIAIAVLVGGFVIGVFVGMAIIKKETPPCVGVIEITEKDDGAEKWFINFESSTEEVKKNPKVTFVVEKKLPD